MKGCCFLRPWKSNSLTLIISLVSRQGCNKFAHCEDIDMRKVRFLGCICLYNVWQIGSADSLFQWNRNAYPALISEPKGISILGAFSPGEEGVGGRRCSVF